MKTILDKNPAATDRRNQSDGKLRDSYDEVYRDEPEGLSKLSLGRWPRNRWEALVHAFPPDAGSVLEIGCGNGIVLHHVADRCRELAGIEIAVNRCRVAEKNLADLEKPVEIISGNIERGIDKADGSFDVIMWADVIEHVVDLFAAMREIHRLLAPGGTLLTATPNVAYLPRRLQLLRGRFPGTSAAQEGFGVRPGEMYDGGHLHYFTCSSLKRLYRQFGFQVVRTVGFGRVLGRLRSLWPSLLSGSALLVGKKTAA
ncbi:MAG TPA: class I SAM-dependent methyltransferase [Thermoguttaceae bacterium]|nr:class I SAM-dependent methyltransferase [Thermoguttaceae bacterium]